MKNGISQFVKPIMSSRPPGAVSTRDHAADLKDLDKVSQITEEPARAAAQMLEEESVQTVASPAAVPKKPAKVAALPWEEVEEGGVISFNFKLPAKLGAKLKYLGGTTYGESMTSIVTETLSAKVDKILKERGLL